MSRLTLPVGKADSQTTTNPVYCPDPTMCNRAAACKHPMDQKVQSS